MDQQPEMRPQQTEEDDEDEDNPMAMRLKKMKEELRNQYHGSDQKCIGNIPLIITEYREENEDNQGYDSYRSPEPALNKKANVINT